MPEAAFDNGVMREKLIKQPSHAYIPNSIG
jgi:hypothetical protein